MPLGPPGFERGDLDRGLKEKRIVGDFRKPSKIDFILLLRLRLF